MASGTFPTGFYWLIEPTIECGGLAEMPRPDEATLKSMPRLGIGLVVSLLEGAQMDYKAPRGLRLAHLAIDDGKCLADIHVPVVARLCAFIHQFRNGSETPNSVAVHCLGGQARTGLMLALYRAYLGVFHPDDLDAQKPSEEAFHEIQRHLHRVYRVWLTGPNGQQRRWAGHFFSELQNSSRLKSICVKARANEVLWHRRVAVADGLLWRCDYCGEEAVGKPGGSSSPMCCPICGRATGGQGIA